MPLLYPDIIQHSNSNLAVADSSYIRGGSTTVTALSDLLTLPIDQIKRYVTRVYVTASNNWYTLLGADSTNSSSWIADVIGGVKVDTTSIIMNSTTKVISALNFANADLTFTSTRHHFLADYSLQLEGGNGFDGVSNSVFNVHNFYHITLHSNNITNITADGGLNLIADGGISIQGNTIIEGTSELFLGTGNIIANVITTTPSKTLKIKVGNIYYLLLATVEGA